MVVNGYIKQAIETWNKMLKTQQEVVKEMIEAQKITIPLFTQFNILHKNTAVFRARVQSGGRISIPEPDRVALNIKEGDVVKVILIKEDVER